MPRENSMLREPVCQRGSSITGLYIASLYEIEENLVSGFEWKNNSTNSLEKVDLGASETLFSMIWGVIFELKDRNKLIFDFIERCYVEPCNATHPGHAAPPEVCCSSLACCSPWACCSLLGMMLPLGMLLPPGRASQFWACCSPRGMLVHSGHAAPPGHAGQFWACCSPRGMLVPSEHPAAPRACSSPGGKASSQANRFKAGNFCSSSFYFSKKGDGLGGVKFRHKLALKGF